MLLIPIGLWLGLGGDFGGNGRERLGPIWLAGRTGGFQALEFLESAVVVAVDGVDASLEPLEDAVGEVEDAAVEVDVGPAEALGVLGFVLPEFGLTAGEAAEEPLAVDEGIDQKAALGRGGGKALLVAGDEVRELVRIFAGDDVGLRIDAGFQGIEAGRGLALSGAWTGGFSGVYAVRLDLFG